MKSHFHIFGCNLLVLHYSTMTLSGKIDHNVFSSVFDAKVIWGLMSLLGSPCSRAFLSSHPLTTLFITSLYVFVYNFIVHVCNTS